MNTNRMQIHHAAVEVSTVPRHCAAPAHETFVRLNSKNPSICTLTEQHPVHNAEQVTFAKGCLRLGAKTMKAKKANV